MAPTALPTGTKILLSCEHTRIVTFNDPHDSNARFWCDECDRSRGFVAILTPVHTYPTAEQMTTLPVSELLTALQCAREDNSGEAWQFRFSLIDEMLTRL
jgi:hypothetical protein